MAVTLHEVRTEAEAAEVRRLAHAFVDWVRDRYPEMQAEIDAYLSRQNFRADLDSLLTVFNPPDGECLLARLDGAPVEILMCKRMDAETCEMNRMYVADAARGLGVGRRLCERLIARAAALGYRRKKLTALHRHHEALALYRSVGFGPDEEWISDIGDREVAMVRVLP